MIAGWGAALPDRVVTNADLEATLDTSDAWITERTGIKERRVGTSTVDLATDAARQALDRAGPGPVDAVILATCTADRTIPASAATVCHRLGLECGSFDLNAACTGFVHAFVTASGLLATGARRVVVVGAETMSRIVDWNDRSTAVLFGDGAGAIVLDAGPADEPTLLGWHAGTDGSTERLLYAEREGTIQMDGPEVFRRAVRVMTDASEQALAAAGLGVGDVDLLVPHQANVRIIDAACRRLGIGEEKVANVLGGTANTSAASIPLALADAADRDRLDDGDVVLTVGFGAGMTWAAAVLRWSTGTGVVQ